MDRDVSIRNLLIITALDSLSYGLIYGFLNPYILKLGGNHVMLGILTIGNLLGELVSSDVIKLFTHLHGRRYSLFFIFNTAMVTHLLMVMTSSYWFTILVRILFSITNQSQTLCLELLLSKAQDDEERKKVQKFYSILSGSGYILGPIISGYLFDIGFGYTGLLAAVLALNNSVLLMKITRDTNDTNPEHADKSVLEKTIQKVSENIEDFKKSSPEKHWDILLLKYLFASSLMIFFSKFTLILKHNYNASSVTMGYTGSYINALVFATTYYVFITKNITDRYPIIFLSEMSFFLLSVLMLLACYAPYYELYMLLLIPVTLVRTYILTLWRELFYERKNDNLMKLNNSSSVVAGLSTPLIFGVVCDKIAHHAVILFSCVPIFLCWGIVRKYSRFLEIGDEKEDNKKDN